MPVLVVHEKAHEEEHALGMRTRRCHWCAWLSAALKAFQGIANLQMIMGSTTDGMNGSIVQRRIKSELKSQMVHWTVEWFWIQAETGVLNKVPPSEAKPDLHEKDKVKASRWPRRTGRPRNCIYTYHIYICVICIYIYKRMIHTWKTRWTAFLFPRGWERVCSFWFS